MVTDINKIDFSKRYTYADYLTWQFDEMVELIKGKVFRMSPAPNLSHQQASSNLHIIIGSYLRRRPCKIFSAPFDVRLPLPTKKQTASKIDTVVQPDLSIICDLSKLDMQGCNGAPDWIIEILSTSTSKKDLTDKFEIYQNAGVHEYWIVHPMEGTIIPYRLNESGKYQSIRPTPFAIGECISVGVFPDLEVELEEVFG